MSTLNTAPTATGLRAAPNTPSRVPACGPRLAPAPTRPRSPDRRDPGRRSRHDRAPLCRGRRHLTKRHVCAVVDLARRRLERTYVALLLALFAVAVGCPQPNRAPVGRSLVGRLQRRRTVPTEAARATGSQWDARASCPNHEPLTSFGPIGCRHVPSKKDSPPPARVRRHLTAPQWCVPPSRSTTSAPRSGSASRAEVELLSVPLAPVASTASRRGCGAARLHPDGAEAICTARHASSAATRDIHSTTRSQTLRVVTPPRQGRSPDANWPNAQSSA